MLVGVPRDGKCDGYRVAMFPVGVEEMVRGGHSVIIERGAGEGSGLREWSEFLHAFRLTCPDFRSKREP